MTCAPTKQDCIKIAFNQGVQAAQNGWERNTPYRGVFQEKHWYAGYDSVIETQYQSWLDIQKTF